MYSKRFCTMNQFPIEGVNTIHGTLEQSQATYGGTYKKQNIDIEKVSFPRNEKTHEVSVYTTNSCTSPRSNHGSRSDSKSTSTICHPTSMIFCHFLFLVLTLLSFPPFWRFTGHNCLLWNGCVKVCLYMDWHNRLALWGLYLSMSIFHHGDTGLFPSSRI